MLNALRLPALARATSRTAEVSRALRDHGRRAIQPPLVVGTGRPALCEGGAVPPARETTMPNLQPRPTLHEEVLEEFAELALELVQCRLCGDYHPPELHLAPPLPFDLTDEPPEA
jgi:hypothetical protein